jgi:hypothetical protein
MKSVKCPIGIAKKASQQQQRQKNDWIEDFALNHTRISIKSSRNIN